MKEKDLIEACINGSQAACKTLYNDYASYVFIICKRYSISQFSIKDMLQTIFMECFNNLTSYDSDKGTFKFWLRRIAINQILLSKRKKRISFQSLEESVTDESMQIDLTIEQLEADAIMAILHKMPTHQAIIFNMRIIDGYSHKEIAEILDIKISTSRSHLLRARNWAIKKLKESGYTDANRKESPKMKILL